ncbi:MAG: hypothetical protein ACRCW0_07280 [Clostridium sp.]|uniref:Uncharacterized protein n=1 Tax=Romboutsia lituseburensis DSM 797 TaxID=1121325 RepID=A0A1G9PEM0_9FIRM|nr:hypothetical protein [Romboutsia lituseburensis]CEH33357.1 Hypothetical protein RLITU_0752 [Romboutsia lituseburensis]SDL97302.1 hypothetical protein SAMN04515677_104332 [Romboutsia lituseburensis DSM 797]
MKKLILTLSFVFLFSSISFAYSREISVENNTSLTEKLGYPVITITNHSNKKLSVDYNYYKYPDKAQIEDVLATVVLEPNESKELHLKGLKFLANTGQVRRVWFTWNIEGRLKPKDAHIDTLPFTYVDKAEEQLG